MFSASTNETAYTVSTKPYRFNWWICMLPIQMFSSALKFPDYTSTYYLIQHCTLVFNHERHPCIPAITKTIYNAGARERHREPLHVIQWVTLLVRKGPRQCLREFTPAGLNIWGSWFEQTPWILVLICSSIHLKSYRTLSPFHNNHILVKQSPIP